MSNKINAQVDNNANEPHPYRGYNLVAQTNLASKVNNTNRLVQNLVQKNDPVKSATEKKEKNDRTLIVRKYKNVKIS